VTTHAQLVTPRQSVGAQTARDPGPGLARYGELQWRIGGISKKMLTQTLRKLESNGLVEGRALRTAPPGAEYRLTELSRSLLEPVASLSRWAEERGADRNAGGGDDGRGPGQAVGAGRAQDHGRPPCGYENYFDKYLVCSPEPAVLSVPAGNVVTDLELPERPGRR
jgi:DNA-binding HxlR family transcriptional regulator